VVHIVLSVPEASALLRVDTQLDLAEPDASLINAST